MRSVYLNATDFVELDVGTGAAVTITSNRWDDVVVWSPWTAMPDCYRCVRACGCCGWLLRTLAAGHATSHQVCRWYLMSQPPVCAWPSRWLTAGASCVWRTRNMAPPSHWRLASSGAASASGLSRTCEGLINPGGGALWGTAAGRFAVKPTILQATGQLGKLGRARTCAP